MKEYKLQDICRIEKGKQIDTAQLNDSSPYKYINGGIKESGYYHEYNTSGEVILVSEGGASCGYVNYITENFWCGCHCYRLTDSKVMPKYLYYALKGNQEKIMELRSGAAMPNIKKETFKNLVLSIDDDKNVQKSVVSSLDSIQTAIDSKKMQLLSLDELVKSRFIEMFGDCTNNTNNWATVKLNDICDVRDGTHDSPEYFSVGVPLITSKNISSGYLDFSNVSLISEKDAEQINKRSKVDKGDILLPMIGTVGGAVIIDIEPNFCIKNVALIKFTKSNISNIFVREYLNSDFVNEIFESVKNGGTQKFVGLGTIRNLPISIPPISLQNEFAEFVKLIDKSKFIVQQQIKDLEELLDSKMDEYFR